MCHIYGFGVPTPFYTAGPQKETRSIEVRGVLFWKFAFRFLAFFWLCCAVLCYMFARSDFTRRSAYSVRFASLCSLRRDVFACFIAIANQTQGVKSGTLAPAKNHAPFQTFNFSHTLEYTRQNIFNKKRVNTL
jgi:hypothetical protein